MSDKKDKKEKKAGDSAKTKGKKLKRVEIIFSAALDEDFAEGFKKNKIGSHFTKLSGVTGAGFSNPKLGDSVWPQLNESLLHKQGLVQITFASAINAASNGFCSPKGAAFFYGP